MLHQHRSGCLNDVYSCTPASKRSRYRRRSDYIKRCCESNFRNSYRLWYQRHVFLSTEYWVRWSRSFYLQSQRWSVPSAITAQLTFNGTAGTNYCYNTSGMVAGQSLRFALQADGTSLATGMYDYTLTVATTIGGSSTTRSFTGKQAIFNRSQRIRFGLVTRRSTSFTRQQRWSTSY